MKHLRIPLVALLALTLSSLLTGLTVSASSPAAQGQSTALERGYRTGYSDGYNAGYKDVADNAARDYQNKDEYQRADRSFNDVWGPIEDYRDGYRQGFEAGYTTGYDRQPFDSSIPRGFHRRQTTSNPQTNPQPVGNSSPEPATPTSVPSTSTPTTTAPADSTSSIASPALIPQDTVLLIELQSGISTDVSQRGDRFQARVVEPREYEGAIIEGRVSEVKRPGKAKGVAELQLSFDSIRMPDNRSSSFSAVVTEVVDMGRNDVGGVDAEGGVKGKSSTKDDISKVGAATGIGAIIGAIAGGGKGAAIGAAIGGGVGTGGVLSKRGKDIQLSRGQQLRIRTSSETRVQ